MLYYYTLPENPYKIESTEYTADLVYQLYYNSAALPNSAQLIELKLKPEYINKVKKELAEYTEKVPLYDIISNRIYLIDKDNVYPRIHMDNYRFIDKNFFENLKLIKNPDSTDLENLRILSNYDLTVLYQTYVKLFYQSYVLNNYITSCRRPSFYQGSVMSPYYTINELYYLAYDWNLTTDPTLNQSQIDLFCSQIAEHDIPARTLLDHQMYIYDSKAIGLVKHYSLFGSYYMNLYLRRNLCCISGARQNYDDVIRNLYLEDQIKIMVRLIKNAPAFTKSHTVYRFIQEDRYLSHLKIGDIYQDPSFMSTTRNPFYYKKNYAFGYILIKIRLPAAVMGVGICIESYSNFPLEEEIVLPPTSKYKLVNIIGDEGITEFHNNFNLAVQKKYEFEWVGNGYIGTKDSDIRIEMPGSFIPEIKMIEMDKLLVDENIGHIPLPDRLKYFRATYANMNNQFLSIIGKNKYTFNLESYNSTSVYKDFFYYEVDDGIMITTANPKYGNINVLMELRSEIHINYYFRYSLTDPSIVVNLNSPEWIHWLSLLSYVVGSRSVIIHPNYIMLPVKTDSLIEKQNRTRYTFCQNIYDYMKHGRKMYEFPEITPNFDYYQFDYLRNVQVTDFIGPADRNELYRIYQLAKIDSMYDFYLYMVENYPQFLSQLESKLDDVYYPDPNPFYNISYKLDPWLYLYRHNLVAQTPSEKEFASKKGSFKSMVGDKKIVQFKNRLRTFLSKQSLKQNL